MIELNQKFNGNFNDWSSTQNARLHKSFVNLNCIAAIGVHLHENHTSLHHTICCKIYDEIFSDGVSSIYLATNAMDKPARIVLRRILELGLAAIYLWDMPHMAYSWNHHDQDLSFTEMLNHINSKGYLSFVNDENSSDLEQLIPSTRAQKIYSDLSDTVHGKITTFESSLPDRFTFSEHKWQQFIKLFEEVTDMLASTFINRFDVIEEVYREVPLARKRR